MRGEVLDLAGVVQLDKLLDRFNRAVHGARPQQCGQCAGEPARHAPQRKQAAVVWARQPGFDALQVRPFSRQMPPGKGTQRRVARNRQHAQIDANGTHFACLVGSQIGDDRRRQCRLRYLRSRWHRLNFGHLRCCSPLCCGPLPNL